MISVGLLSRGAGRGIPARGIGLFPEQHGPDHRLREVLKQYYLQLAFDREFRAATTERSGSKSEETRH